MTNEEQLNHMASQINEIQDRTRRTETNMHKIRECLGMEAPGAKQQVKVIDKHTVEVQGYDVTLSRIKRELQTANVFELYLIVDVMLAGKTISQISFDE